MKKEVLLEFDPLVLYTDGTYQSTSESSQIRVGSESYSYYQIKGNKFYFRHSNEADFSDSTIVIPAHSIAKAKFDKELKELLDETDSASTR